MDITLLERVQADLAAQAGRDVVIDAGKAEFAGILGRLFRLLGVDAFRLDGIAVSEIARGGSGAAQTASFTVQAKVDLLAMSGIDTLWTFFLSQDARTPGHPELECLVEPRNLPANWDLTTVFVDPPGYIDYSPDKLIEGRQESFFRHVTLGHAKLLLSSFDFLAAAQANRGHAAAIIETSLSPAQTFFLPLAVLRAGINIAADISLDGAFWDDIRRIKPDLPALDVRGAIMADERGDPVIDIAHDFGSGAALELGGPGSIALALKELHVRSGLCAWSDTFPGFFIVGALKADDWEIELMLDLAIGGASAILTGDFGAGTPATLGHLERALGLGGLADHLPQAVETLGELGLRRLEAGVSLSPPGLTDLIFTIGTSEAWKIVPDVIEVEPLLHFGVLFDGGEHTTTLDISGIWRLGSSTFEVDISPDTGDLFARLAVGETLDVDALFGKVLHGVERPKFEILDLDLTGNFKDGRYALELEADSDWTFEVGGKQFGLSDIEMVAQYDPSGISGSVTGALVVAGWAVHARVELEETITVQARLPELDLGDLADHFLHFVHLPAEIPAFRLRELDLSVTPSTSEFHISGSSDTPVEIVEGFGFRMARFDVQRTPFTGSGGGAGKSVTAMLDLDLALGAELLRAQATRVTHEADGQPTQSHWGFVGSLSSAIPLGHLILAFERMVGLGYPLPIDGITISDLHLAFDLGDVPTSGSAPAQRAFVLDAGIADDGKPWGAISFVASKAAAGVSGKPPAWDYAATTRLGLDIGLAELPLIGPQLASVGGMRLHGVEVTRVSRDYTLAEVQALLLQLPANAAAPPSKALSRGFNVQALVSLADPAPIMIGVPLDAGAQSPAPILPASAATDPTQAMPVPMAADETRWFPVGKSLGAVDIARVGLRFRDSELALMLDAAVNLGAFKLSFLGLGAGSRLDRFAPVFNLDGLGLSYSAGPLSIAGGFLRTPAGAYAGQVRAQLGAFGLTALGEYGTVDGHASLAVFGQLQAPLGGPPYFFVDGVAMGMGYSSQLQLPDIDAVANFSLVRAVLPGPGPFSQGGDVASVLRAMSNDIRMVYGGQWIAAGIRFNSNKMVNSVALVTVNFGHSLAVELVGLSQASLPPLSADPIAFVELAFQAVCNPDAGLLAVSGKLTPNSFVLSHNAHLLGGFAFHTWFGGGHAGDFVFTLGGYHPHFQRPAHYPAIERMSLLWQVNDRLGIKGTSYFAMTPQMLMAGGSLEAVWGAGDLRAWFTMQSDFLIHWKPFAYDAEIACGIGVSYRLHLLFTTVTISVHVGVDLSLHGPPFGGEARIDLSVVSFTISFGGSAPDWQPIDWQSFKDTFLPPPVSGAAPTLVATGTGATPVATNTLCTLAPTAGLMRDLSKESRPDGIRWVFNPAEIILTTSSSLPITEAFFNGAAEHGGWRAELGIGPVAVAASDLRSKHHVSLTRFNPHSNAEAAYDLGRLQRTPVIRSLPQALWSYSAGRKPALGGDALLDNALAGFVIAPPPFVPDHTRPVDVARFQYEEASDPRAFPWTDAEAAKNVFPAPSAIARSPDDVLTPILADTARAARAEIIAALLAEGLAITPAEPSRFGRSTVLSDWPAIRPLSEA